MESLNDYLDYHISSSKIGDIDPANDCLRYIANRFELNMEQRYWLAFLYSTCYCGPTVFYMYNEFPDFDRVDEGRLERWWRANKQRCVFQTDRLRIKTTNQFVPTFKSYREWVGGYTQQERFSHLMTPSPYYTWKQAEKEVRSIRNIGRFTSFIYLELVTVLTDFITFPDTIEWENADNCRKGLSYAHGLEDSHDYEWLDIRIKEVQRLVKGKCLHTNIFNIETTLCAYKKYKHGKRHVGYYIDRQFKEIEQMKKNVPEGVCWRVLDQFRKETYNQKNLQLCEITY